MSDPGIEAKLAAVKQAYVASLADKCQAIAELWGNLQQHWSAEEFDALHLIVHGLAGSAETFGFADITRAARRVVDDLRQIEKQPPPAAGWARIDRQLAELLALLEKHQA